MTISPIVRHPESDVLCCDHTEIRGERMNRMSRRGCAVIATGALTAVMASAAVIAPPLAAASACTYSSSVFRPSSIQAQGIVNARGCPNSGYNLCVAGRLFRSASQVVASLNSCQVSRSSMQFATAVGRVAPGDRPAMQVDKFYLVRVPNV